MPNYYSLSHILSASTPAYGNGVKPVLEIVNSIKNGASSNKTKIIIDSHLGTHLDFPFHFIDNGKKGEEYLPCNFVFHFPFVIDLPVQNGLITNELLKAFSFPQNIDLLLIKTGTEYFRSSDKYWQNGPGMAAETAMFLKQKMPRLKAIGFDFISLSSYQHRAEGREAHNKYLSNNILIIEDMKLSVIDNSLNFLKIVVAPLLFTNCDAAPVYVLAETE
jgi:kynurenine formamidase